MRSEDVEERCLAACRGKMPSLPEVQSATAVHRPEPSDLALFHPHDLHGCRATQKRPQEKAMSQMAEGGRGGDAKAGLRHGIPKLD
jgi:hypothetical protein